MTGAAGHEKGQAELVAGHVDARTTPRTTIAPQSTSPEDAAASSLSPATPESCVKDPSEMSHSSFDPDSPLPTSRAPRHSLLLALTTSPLKLDETSPIKSPSNSPSPTRHELLFAPEYHDVTTPSRPRQKPMSVTVTETPTGQATSRHRLSRALRQEQAMIERQATINDKLSAISLSMSGMKASFYGASSTGQAAQVLRESDRSPIPATSTKQRTPSRLVQFPRNSPVTLNSVSVRRESDDKAASIVVEPEQSLCSKTEAQSRSENHLHASAGKLAQSRIPKPIFPPSQPVFRKPTISGLPTLKPSLLPTKSLSSSTSSVPPKPASTITMSYKAARPEAGHLHELAKYATPVKGRLTSSMGFRSPAASRVIFATNPIKPIHGRNVSGNMPVSIQSAVRPMTPGKPLSRSVTTQAGSPTAVQREKEFKSPSMKLSSVSVYSRFTVFSLMTDVLLQDCDFAKFNQYESAACGCVNASEGFRGEESITSTGVTHGNFL